MEHCLPTPHIDVDTQQPASVSAITAVFACAIYPQEGANG